MNLKNTILTAAFGVTMSALTAQAASINLTKQQVVASYSKLPLTFEANAGQTDSHVRFLSRGPGYTLFLTTNEAVLVSGKDKPGTVRMKLVDANPAPEVQGLDELSGKNYYFIGNNPNKWHSKVANYAQVRYQAVYPGVDLVYYGNQRQLEYDFLVAPQADPKCIQLSFPDAQHIRIDQESGNLKLEYGGSEVQFQKPVAYQIGDGKSLVQAQYVLRGEQISITVGNYDTTKPLIIDPVLIYSTLLGGATIFPGTSGSSPNYGFSIAVDSSGNAYVTGFTLSPDFPIANPLPAPNNVLQGYENAFVSKLSFNDKTSTLSLVYSAYLGGSGGDEGLGIAVDSSGDAYVTGVTDSTDFPTVNPLPAPNNALQGIQDAFVSKLKFDSRTSTLSLVYSTFLGGSGYDYGFGGIAVDASGNAYVTGYTYSPDFPIVNPLPAPNNAFQGISGEGLQGDINAFVSKLRFNSVTSKLSLVYSTYLGGKSRGDGIAVDSSGNAYVTGATGSTDFPIVNPLPPPNNAFRGIEDAFVSKLKFDNLTSTLSLVYSTFLGGSSTTSASEGYGIAVDASGNAYVTGFTGSTDFPIVNPLPPPNNALQGVLDAFVSKLSFNGSPSKLSLAYSIFLGGSDADYGYGIAVDADGNAYVTGATESSFDFPTAHPLPPHASVFGYDAFVTKLSSKEQSKKNEKRSGHRSPEKPDGARSN